jgi:hypothetical protein
MGGGKTVEGRVNSVAAALGPLPDGIEGVRQSLKTDVIGIIQSEVSALASMSRDDAYDRVMNNPELLDGCFRLFRSKPDLFSKTIVDRDGKPATQDNALLVCGRTLADAITLIVRAAAKRYFRNHSSHIPAADGQQGIKAADYLYNSIKDLLLYEWQSRLIPNYLRMPVTLFKQMGARLFDFREPSELTSLAEGVEPANSRRPPLLLDNATRVLVRGRETIDPEILWTVCQQMDLGRLYPGHDMKALRVAVAQISAAQPQALSPMMPVLGNDIRRFCVFLFVVHSQEGAARFKAVYGEGGQVHVVRGWMARLQEMSAPKPILTELKTAYGAVIAAGATYS